MPRVDAAAVALGRPLDSDHRALLGQIAADVLTACPVCGADAWMTAPVPPTRGHGEQVFCRNCAHDTGGVHRFYGIGGPGTASR